MFQISEVQESPAFNGRPSFLTLRGRLQALQTSLGRWTADLIEPRFEGLKLRSKEKPSDDSKPDAKVWKHRYFAKHPNADADNDGELTWLELKGLS